MERKCSNRRMAGEIRKTKYQSIRNLKPIHIHTHTHARAHTHPHTHTQAHPETQEWSYTSYHLSGPHAIQMWRSIRYSNFYILGLQSSGMWCCITGFMKWLRVVLSTIVRNMIVNHFQALALHKTGSNKLQGFFKHVNSITLAIQFTMTHEQTTLSPIWTFSSPRKLSHCPKEFTENHLHQLLFKSSVTNNSRRHLDLA